MVEMLITAFIMAVGILGLTMLQVMSMKASRGSRSLTTAVLVGEHLMDRVEMEGRLSWLNISNTDSKTASNADLPSLTYVTLADGTSLNNYFDLNGDAVAATDAAKFYTVTTTRTALAPAAFGSLSDFTVEVNFTDQVDKSGTKINRKVSLARRVVHG
ncbi:hypothetical protein GETHLI_25030 [Geothrix limicola]|uniref:Uncharacterized protein n=2 Tax=Geothrix limicola TaxID=2927978 RepID=A0ABQ5QHW2_9BACT|nr:hypothetical protein GETHLI_25030 [Geothrix limicola]